MEPTADHVDLPAAYGSPDQLLHWSDVEQRLTEAMVYWLATTQPSGGPHVVPVDGMWLDGAAWFGGHPSTQHTRNLRHDPRAVLHLENGTAAVIVHGVAAVHVPDDAGAERLAATAKAKYGYGQPASTYREGVWRLAPVKVLAWNQLHRDATRFRFASE
ncbi:MAG TPA: pyridoxamine 5'-phosphate oxidase family protein [Lapillicoccus sp.]|jgi:nitroimidazol reductase NimA-like FMN-containing flavoprotein (pyridoxamine 5'-phosphate oxidase superfamily)